MKRIYLTIFVLFLGIGSSALADSSALNPENLCVNLSQNLRFGSLDENSANQVSKLQTFLNSRGYLNVKPTGYFGSLTRAAVIKYQKVNEIEPVAGFVGPITRESIRGQSCHTVTDKNAPYINLEIRSQSKKSSAALKIKEGDEFEITGTPANIAGLEYGEKGYTAAWFFGPAIENSCHEMLINDTDPWYLRCETQRKGTTNIYAEIYKNNQTYKSNIITLTIE